MYIRLIQCGAGNGECGNRREENALRYERRPLYWANEVRGADTVAVLQSCQAREDMMDYSWNQESDSESA
jgi:hypothetical protein